MSKELIGTLSGGGELVGISADSNAISGNIAAPDSTELIGILSDNNELVGVLGSGDTISGDVIIPGGAPYQIPPATRRSIGGIIVGEDLEITADGVLSVQKATEVESDNTHPITSAAVYTTVGNINALLATI